MNVTLITGASSGLGAALAPHLATDCDVVALAARRLEPLEVLVKEIEAQGGRAIAVQLDVTDHDAVLSACARLVTEVGPITRVVANAGIGDNTPAARFEALVLKRIFDVNVNGVAHVLEAVLPGMIERGHGHIVGIASLAGSRGMPGSGAYAASKAALRVLLESLRIELAPIGVAVTTINPGFVRTPLTDRNRFKMPYLVEVDVAAEKMFRAITRKDAEFAFPWQLASAVGAARLLPNALYDRAMRGRSGAKSTTP